MRTLKLFIIQRETCGALDVSVLRDIDEVIERGSNAVARGAAVLVHCGHARPSDGALQVALAAHAGSVLLTEAARWALPAAVSANTSAQGQMSLPGMPSEIPLHLALSGWGYERAAPVPQKAVPAAQARRFHRSSQDEVSEWLSDAQVIFDDAARRLAADGVTTDDEFWGRADLLSRDEMSRLRMLRSKYIANEFAHAPPQRIAHSSPSWLREMPIVRLRLRRRTENVLTTRGLIVVADLEEWPDSRLTSLRNFGTTSLDDLRVRMIQVLTEGPKRELAPALDAAARRLLPAKHVMERWEHLRQAVPNEMRLIGISCLRLRNRASGVLEIQGIRTIGELMALDEQTLLSFDNFGMTSMREVYWAVADELDGESIDSKVDAKATGDLPIVHSDARGSNGLLEELNRTLADLPESHRRIIQGRLSSSGKRHTLDELGIEVGLTKERVRQIARVQTREIIDTELWDDLLREKLRLAREGRTSPLLPEYLMIADPWFAGFEDNSEYLCGIIEAFGEGCYYCWDLDGTGRVITTVSSEAWEAMGAKLRAVMSQPSEEPLRVSDIRRFAEMVAQTEGASDLIEPLAELVLGEALVDEQCPGDDPVILCLKTSISEVCRQALQGSDLPMHFRDVANKVGDLLGRSVTVEHVHGVLNREALLFGRGCYGLHKHLKYTTEIADAVRSFIAEVIGAGPPDRQWHCDELLSLLQQEGGILPDEATAYEVCIMATGAPEIEYLGRLVWMGVSAQERPQGRRMIANIVESAIINAGHPLGTDQLWKRVAEERGVSSYRLIPETDRVIRTAPGVFGLIDRDLGLSTDEMNEWATLVREEMSADGTLTLARIEQIKWRMSSSGLRLCSAELLMRLASKQCDCRVTRSNGLIGQPRVRSLVGR